MLILWDWATANIGKDVAWPTVPKLNIPLPLSEETKEYWSIWHLGDIAYDLRSDNGKRGDAFLNDIEK